jgi:N utilization substance protein B
MDDALKDFISQIVSGVVEFQQTLDEFIADFAPDWPLDQVAVIDRNLLRMALWEIAVYEETPVKVAINEAVELAKVYGSDGTARFINGVLGGFIDNLDEIKVSLEILRDQENG